MIFHVYLRKGIVYVPIVAQTTAGFYGDQEPVMVVPASQSEPLRQALKNVIARGNPKIPTPTRANMPAPVVLKHAGVKDWGSFARNALLWTMKATDNTYQIIGHQRSPGGSFKRDAAQIVTMPPGSKVDDVIERMISILQESAREQPL